MGKFILNLNGPLLKLPNNIVDGSFDYVGRYQLIAEIIHRYFDGKNPKNILDVGGLGTFLDKIIDTPLTILDEEAHDADQEKKGDGARMNFEDGAFEAVVTSDTLEHIPQKDRKKFVSELVRVSSDLVILCAPFDNKGVAKEEMQLQNFYTSVSGHPHRWLKEHAEYKLPNVAYIKQCFEDLGISYLVVGHSTLALWRQIMGMNLLANEMGNRDVSMAATKVNKYYNQNILFEDFEQEGYRTFIIASKKRNISYQPNTNKMTIEHSLELLGLISDFYMTAITEPEYVPILRKKVKDLHDSTMEFAQQIERLNKKLELVKSENKSLLHSRSWRYTAPLRKVDAKIVRKKGTK